MKKPLGKTSIEQRARIINGLGPISFVVGGMDAWQEFFELPEEEYPNELAQLLIDFATIWAGLMEQDILIGVSLGDAWQADRDKANLACNLSGQAIAAVGGLLCRVWIHGAELRRLLANAG